MQPVAGALFPGQDENGKTYMIGSKHPVVHLSPRARGWVCVESVTVTPYVVHKVFLASVSLSFTLRM